MSVESQPGVAEVDARMAEAEAAWRDYLAWKSSVEQEFDAAMTEYKRAVGKAIDRRELPPPAPVPPLPPGEHENRLVTHKAAMEELRRQRFAAISSAASEIRADARTEIDQAVAACEPLVAALSEELTRIRQAEAAVQQVFVAQDVLTGMRVQRPAAAPAEISDVIDAVLRGRDLLPGPAASAVMTDRSGRLGLQFSTFERLADSYPEPPNLPEPPRVPRRRFGRP